MDYLRVTVRRLELDVPLIEVAGVVSNLSCDGLRSTIGALVAQGQRDVIVDLSGVHHLDRAGLAVLVGALRVCNSTGGTIRIVCDVRSVRRIFELTELDKILPLYHSEEQALQAALASAA